VLRLPDRPAVDYQVARDNNSWNDHVLRVRITAGLLSWLRPTTVVDPACGDASVVLAAHRINPIERALLGDISRPNFYRVGTELRPLLPSDLRVACQSIEETLSDPYTFDVVVLTEILEHVEDPYRILKMARERADMLVASSPLFPHDGIVYDTNPEHLWQFSASSFEEMLLATGWKPTVFMPIYFAANTYDYQLVAAK
jgi:SAM-dependent methyltransferase